MRTDDLIAALAADAPRREPGLDWSLALAAVLGALSAAALLLATIGVRPDVGAALGTLRFPAKFLPTLALVAASLFVLRDLARPTPTPRRRLAALVWPLVILGIGVALEFLVLPADRWLPVAVGRNSLLCLTVIPALSALPLVFAFAVLRRAAPERPTLAGAVAGLLSAGIGASFYATHCPDDSPLFLAVWYVAAIAIVTTVGALAGRRLLAW